MQTPWVYRRGHFRANCALSDTQCKSALCTPRAQPSPAIQSSWGPKICSHQCPREAPAQKPWLTQAPILPLAPCRPQVCTPWTVVPLATVTDPSLHISGRRPSPEVRARTNMHAPVSLLQAPGLHTLGCGAPCCSLWPKPISLGKQTLGLGAEALSVPYWRWHNWIRISTPRGPHPVGCYSSQSNAVEGGWGHGVGHWDDFQGQPQSCDH